MWKIGLVKQQGWANLKKNLGMGILVFFLLGLFGYFNSVMGNFVTNMRFSEQMNLMLKKGLTLGSSATLEDWLYLFSSDLNTNRTIFLSLLEPIFSLAALAVTILLLEPIGIGFHRWFLENRQEKPSVEPLFLAFRKGNYKKILAGSSWQLLWKIIWGSVATLAVLPGFILLIIGLLGSFLGVYGGSFNGNRHTVDENLLSFMALMTIIGLIALVVGSIISLIIWTNRYYAYVFAPFFLADNPDMGARNALNASKSMAKGQKMQLFVFDLSFIGWYLLGIMTCGILFLGITPYRYSALAEVYAQLKGTGSEMRNNTL